MFNLTKSSSTSLLDPTILEGQMVELSAEEMEAVAGGKACKPKRKHRRPSCRVKKDPCKGGYGGHGGHGGCDGGGYGGHDDDDDDDCGGGW